MKKYRIKKLIAASSYNLGLTKLLTKLGGYLVISKRKPFYYVRLKENESFSILMYHRVNSNNSLFTIDAVPTFVFERQMEYISGIFNILSIDEILDRLEQKRKLPKRCMAITFDDGYEDNYTNAFPVLRKYKIPATIFLTVGCIENGTALWFEKVLYAFEKTEKQYLKLPESENIFYFPNLQEKYKTAVQVLEILKKLSGAARLKEISKIYSALCVEEPETQPNQMLNWEQIQEMVKNGISIGSHTMTHPILSKIHIEEAKREIISSKEIIGNRINQPVRLFAYPNGRPSDFNDDIIELLKKVGYKAAVTTSYGLNSSKDDHYRWKRILTWEHDLHLFALSLSYFLINDEESIKRIPLYGI